MPNKELHCAWASHGLGLHNSGRTYLCCHSRRYLRDDTDQEIYLDTHSVEQAWASPTRREIQQSLAQGHEHPNCQACWDDEHTGKKSRRQHANEMFADLEDLETQPQILDLKLGNTCNMRCRTCNPEVSSQWYREDWELTAKVKEGIEWPQYLKRWKRISASYSDDNQRLWDSLGRWIHKVVYIDYYGAEPMLIRKNFEVLELAVAQGQASNMVLHVNTNGTIWDDYHEKLFANFKCVLFDVSVDDIKDRCGYIRHNGGWAEIVDNLKKIKQFVTDRPGWNVSVCVTVNCYNIYYLDEIVDYFYHDQNVDVNINMLHLPNHLNIKILPDDVKAKITHKLQRHVRDIPNINPPHLRSRRDYWNQQTQSLIKFLQTPMHDAEIHLREFCYYTRGLDRTRSQDFASTLPELAAMMKPIFDQYDQATGLSALSDASG